MFDAKMTRLFVQIDDDINALFKMFLVSKLL